jgi:SAM-dependent methyltransferase
MSNEEQIEFWNGETGERWAQRDDMMARLLQPVADLLLDHTDLAGRSRALDVGCGGGSQSRALAQRLGAGASVLGVDISGPLLQVARDHAAMSDANLAAMEFVQADASSHAFDAHSFDLVFSRFGVMFFDDPVAAFSNIRTCMNADAGLLFSCWQGLKDNDWLLQPMQAALQFVPAPPPSDPMAPGPFAFADPDRLRSILADSGFADIELQPRSITLRFGEAPTLQQNARDLIQIGPIGSLLEGQDQTVREQVEEAVVAALEPYFHDQALHLPGAIWVVTATTG